MFPFSKPSNNKNWELDQKVLPSITRNGGLISIKNIRNFHYRSELVYDIDYYDKTFCLDEIKTATIGFVPFSKTIIVVHAFVKFDFKDKSHVVFSVELRKKKGQKFSFWKNILPYCEIMYVIADQQDVIDLRVKHRENESVDLYELNLKAGQLRQIFWDMCVRANNIHSQPEFFSLFLNNCTSNLIDHLNKAADYRIPWFYKHILPGFLRRYLLKNRFVARQ
ncbi:MAG: DUF4105 domain-containing protein [Candidatus Colwellbacteria bacterium]|nr:DUF4105 domain-containing protein [Candidatus Colwellbacteria bacterium]